MTTILSAWAVSHLHSSGLTSGWEYARWFILAVAVGWIVWCAAFLVAWLWDRYIGR